MKFVFDPRKEQRNIAKHGLDFSLAEAVFADPLASEVYDRFENGEHRYHLCGLAGSTSRLITVVYTFPDPNDEDTIRVISVRKATKPERRRYEETFE
jgi:uncharacterized DUF497 family protein